MALRARAIVSAALGALLAAACIADLGGFSGGGDDAPPPPPASSDAPSASPPPAPPPQPPVDAGGDAATLCAPGAGHVVCDDFGGGDGGWSGTDAVEGGLLEPSTSAFVSPPAALEMLLPALGVGREAWAFPYITVPKTTTKVHLAFSVRACDPGTGAVGLASVQHFTAGGTIYASVDVGVNPTDGGSATYILVNDGTNKTSFGAGAPLPTDKFSRVVMDVTLDPNAGSVTLTVDGVVRSAVSGIPTDTAVAPTRRAVWIGAYGFETPSCAVVLDDAIVDLPK